MAQFIMIHQSKSLTSQMKQLNYDHLKQNLPLMCTKKQIIDVSLDLVVSLFLFIQSFKFYLTDINAQVESLAVIKLKLLQCPWS